MKTDCLLQGDEGDDFFLSSILIDTTKINMFFTHFKKTKREKDFLWVWNTPPPCEKKDYV